jgi:hypothetical protein
MSDQSEKPSSDESVGDDILRGAIEIRAELRMKPEDVYYAAKHGLYPITRLGKTLIASRKQLRRYHRALTQKPATAA